MTTSAPTSRCAITRPERVASRRGAALWLLLGALAAGPAAADCRDLATPRAVPTAAEGQWSLATFNLWRLRDTEKNSPIDRPLDDAVYQARLDALAGYIVDTLKAPVLLAVQEVENLAILEQLAQRVTAQGGPRYRALLLEGHDPAGMDVALLHRAPAEVADVRVLFADQRFRGQPLFSRPPLAVTLTAPRDMTLVIVHLRSANGLGEKAWVAEKRRRQATGLAQWSRAGSDQALAVVGDFNSAPDSGAFSEPWTVMAASGLYNSWDRVKKAERYSYRHRCRPQTLDYVWLSEALKGNLRGVAISRGNAGRYDRLYGGDGTEVVSDHDVLVTYFD
jgi:endonuclease/exonuclease/phosphatase family metal-dependent hydrolase